MNYKLRELVLAQDMLAFMQVCSSDPEAINKFEEMYQSWHRVRAEAKNKFVFTGMGQLAISHGYHPPELD